jgi:dihydrofolate reductase
VNSINCNLRNFLSRLPKKRNDMTQLNRKSSIVNRKLAAVVAMDRNRLIGADNGLPWRLPDDMGWFVEKTMGKPVIMGRKTYESIPAKFRPLKGRHNIVLSRSRDYAAPGATAVHSIAAALEAAGDVPEIIIGGGATLYAQLLPQTSRLYLTLIDAEFAGDAFFPKLDWSAWRETFRQQHPADERHAYPFTWLILERDLVEVG